jgi:cyclopropane fatty-acyl-phospholipid synthase-like methyltransferase
MFDFHKDRKRYFEMQVENAAQYVIPFIENVKTITSGTTVLEIGCGEAGVLKAFIAKGCTAVGVELEEGRLEEGKKYLSDEISEGKLHLIASNIYTIKEDFRNSFDIIILKDVIEHIHDQPKLIAWMKDFLKPNGLIFFGFPPWYMPWGGHQQICKTNWIAKMPYIHLLPNFLYKYILQKNKESVDELLEIKETGISIERFERICRKMDYTLIAKKHYLINPIYQYKFGWKPRVQLGIIKAIPFVRNFFTTCVYYCITPKK